MLCEKTGKKTNGTCAEPKHHYFWNFRQCTIIYIYIIIYTCIMWMGFRLILPGGRTHVQPGTKFATQKPFYTNHFDPKHIHMSYPSSDVLVCFCESWTVCYNSSFTLSTLQGKEEPRDAHTGNHVRRCKASAEDAVAEAMVVE
jgi:hypothetical protein